jgi:hypothetical protein
VTAIDAGRGRIPGAFYRQKAGRRENEDRCPSATSWGPEVCGLAAGGKWIRNFGSATLAPPTARPRGAS